MAKTNRDRVEEALEFLAKGLLPFVEREVKTVHGDKWKAVADQSFGGKKLNWSDPQAVLTVMWDQWNTVFKNVLGYAERSLVSELRDVRNR